MNSVQGDGLFQNLIKCSITEREVYPQSFTKVDSGSTLLYKSISKMSTFRKTYVNVVKLRQKVELLHRYRWESRIPFFPFPFLIRDKLFALFYFCGGFCCCCSLFVVLSFRLLFRKKLECKMSSGLELKIGRKCRLTDLSQQLQTKKTK